MNATTNAAELPALLGLINEATIYGGLHRLAEAARKEYEGMVAQSQQEPVALTTMPTSEEVFKASREESNQSHQDFIRGVQWLQRKLKESTQ